ncbi:MAG: hypothetical protein ACU0DK_04300 [Pseudooceanicola sp.]
MLRRAIDRPARAVAGLILLASIAAVAGVIVLSNADLDAEATLAGLPPEEALAELEALPEPLSPQLAFLRAQRLAESGASARAGAELAALADRDGETVAILLALADLAQRTGEIAAAGDYLARADRLRPDPVRLHRRAALTRDLGPHDEERALLARIGSQALDPSEALRLADLSAWAGDHAALETLALARIARGGSDRDQMAFRLAVSTLSRGATDALAEAVLGWHDNDDLDALLAAVMPALAVVPGQSADLARRLSRDAPGLRPVLTGQFGRAGLHVAARVALADHLATVERMAPADWTLLADYADRSGDLSLLRQRLVSPGNAVPGRALEPLIRYEGIGSLAGIRTLVTPELRRETPLVDAAWQAWQQRPDLAYEALLRAARGAAGDEDGRRLWISIARELEATGYWQRLLAMRGTDGDVAAMFTGWDD